MTLSDDSIRKEYMPESAARTRLFVPGLYTWGNKGDAALALSFLPWLESAFGTREMTLTSFTPELDEPHYGYPVLDMIIRPRTPLHKFSSGIARRVRLVAPALTVARMFYTRATISYLSVWARIYKVKPHLARRLVPRHVSRVADAIDSADTVISIPGGYLNALRFTDDLWLFHIPTFMLASFLGKPAILGPCSIGPFVPSHRGFARRALAHCQLILVRENTSMDILGDLEVPESKLMRTPDMAFALGAERITELGIRTVESVLSYAAGRDIVGVSVRHHSFPGHSDPTAMQADYLAQVASSVNELAEQGAVIVVVPQTLEDISIGRDFATTMREHYPLAPLLIVEDDLTPADLQELYRQFRLLVGTRMHANILAMSSGTAVAAIAYEPKTLGILERMGLSEWGIWIDQLDNGRLHSLVHNQWKSAATLGELAEERSRDQRKQMGDIASTVVARANRPLHEYDDLSAI